MSVILKIKMHDKFRLELITVSHPQQKPLTFDLFWFFPKELDVTQSSYPKPLFYRYLKNNMRYRIPDQTLTELTAPDNRYIKILVDEIINENDLEYHHALRLLSNIFVKALKKEINVHTANEKTEDILQANIQVKAVLRRLRAQITISGQGNKFGFQTVNQYCSSEVIQTYLACIADIPDGQIKNALLKTVAEENEYRHANKMSALDNNASFIKSVRKLKLIRRYCEGTLFLKTRRSEEGVVAQQIIFSLAAALSMMFAMLIAFWSQQKFGNFTTSFLAAMVLGYIVKDRLKELSREVTYLRLSRYLFDFSTQLQSERLLRKPTIGTIKEVVQFIKPRKLDNTLRNFYQQQANYSKDSYESVLMYRRQFKTSTKIMPKGIDQYVNFTLFNLRKMLRNASYQDYPFFYQKGSKVICRMVQKSYPIELVARITGDGEARYQHYTLTVTRKGIRRIHQASFNDN
ncbi:hypothetical protein [sulfur-oxidizing endosymbiont of Gigantopelta aegis]|uniref:hypothetical protein n=1 Tax=sulfur-oxidizing endosymbiont of Gigantopelta aegis TaxID=2794934 RepID=UPI0018DD19D2|nr:hypothetical protein [sulfur-oxidizing endosymbiont of Gigantopelta aegis]